MSDPRVSVIVPCCNGARTIAATLDSLRCQAFPDWEAVVVNDGSADDSLKIVSDYASRDARIRHISQDNQGLGAARNAGLELARGHYLLFLDADDTLLPTMLKRMLSCAERQDSVDLVHCGWILADATLANQSWKVRASPPAGYFASLAHGNLFPCHALLLRRGLLEKTGCFDRNLKHCHDWDLWVRVSRVASRIAVVAEPLVVYRMIPASLSRRATSFFAAGREVIRRAHAPDPRLKDPSARHAAGCCCNMRRALHDWALQCLSIAVAQSSLEEADAVLSLSESESSLRLQPSDIHQLISNLWFATATPPGEWQSLWAKAGPALLRFVQAAETRYGRNGFSWECVREIFRCEQSLAGDLDHVSGPRLLAAVGSKMRRRVLRLAGTGSGGKRKDGTIA